MQYNDRLTTNILDELLAYIPDHRTYPSPYWAFNILMPTIIDPEIRRKDEEPVTINVPVAQILFQRSDGWFQKSWNTMQFEMLGEERWVNGGWKQMNPKHTLVPIATKSNSSIYVDFAALPLETVDLLYKAEKIVYEKWKKDRLDTYYRSKSIHNGCNPLIIIV